MNIENTLSATVSSWEEALRRGLVLKSVLPQMTRQEVMKYEQGEVVGIPVARLHGTLADYINDSKPSDDLYDDIDDETGKARQFIYELDVVYFQHGEVLFERVYGYNDHISGGNLPEGGIYEWVDTHTELEAVAKLSDFIELAK